MKYRTRIANWNVRTLYGSDSDARLAQAEAEMLTYRLQILGLSEVRWNGFGEVRTPKGLTFLYSGKEDEDDTREFGVGFLLSDEAKKSLLDWKPISDRIITARFNSKVRKITVVQCYSPTNDALEDDKELFYSALQGVLRNIKKQDIVIVMGDLNAKVGNDNTSFSQHMGVHGLGTQNENGELFVEFCANNDLVIGGTLFPHKDIHKFTWNSPDQRTKNQIDHIAISRKWRSSLLDVRNRRGADIDSDHHLVVGELRLKVAKPCLRNTPKKVGRKFDVDKLKGAATQEKFKLEIRNRFSNLNLEETDIETEWKHIKMAYIETSSATLGHRESKRKDWISQTTWDLIDERKDTNLKILSAPLDQRSELVEQYRCIRKKIYRSTRKDRRVQANRVAERAQLAANSGNLRELYKATKTLAEKFSIRKVPPVRDKDGKPIPTAEGRLRRWHEHFVNVFKQNPADPPANLPSSPSQVLSLDISVDPPNREEVAKAIASLKTGKAPGLDLLTSEILQADPPSAVDVFTPLLAKIWDAEILPDDWNKGLLVTVPKKGDLSQCNNWRGITLLSVPSKILSKVILDRLTKAVEPQLRREQAGFRASRSCTDQINTLRIIVEQASEFQRELYMTFVDFEKAFDFVQWGSIWARLSEIGVPSKITNLIKAMYAQYTCQVSHDGLISDDIKVHAGVRQGCLLSPLLFLIVLDGIMIRANKNKRRGIEWGLSEILDDLDYADDLCLLSHRCADMQAKIDDLKQEAAAAGLKINTGKTKEMRSGVNNETPLHVGQEQVERVHRFTYLGSVVSVTGGTEEDITSRIAKARATFAQLRPVWQSQKLTRWIKLKIFRSNVKTVLLYGCETWKVTKDLTYKLQVCVNRCLRHILRIFWPEKISNAELLRRCHESPIDQQIKRRKWNWIGHTLRRAPDHIPKQALDWNPQGKRKRGRPKQTWRRSVMDEIKYIHKTWPEVKHEAQDRTRWRITVDALCPTQGT